MFLRASLASFAAKAALVVALSFFQSAFGLLMFPFQVGDSALAVFAAAREFVFLLKGFVALKADAHALGPHPVNFGVQSAQGQKQGLGHPLAGVEAERELNGRSVL